MEKLQYGGDIDLEQSTTWNPIPVQDHKYRRHVEAKSQSNLNCTFFTQHCYNLTAYDQKNIQSAGQKKRKKGRGKCHEGNNNSKKKISDSQAPTTNPSTRWMRKGCPHARQFVNQIPFIIKTSIQIPRHLIRTCTVQGANVDAYRSKINQLSYATKGKRLALQRKALTEALKRNYFPC